MGSWGIPAAFLPLGTGCLLPASAGREGAEDSGREGPGRLVEHAVLAHLNPLRANLSPTAAHMPSQVPGLWHRCQPQKEFGDLKRKERAWFHICFGEQRRDLRRRREVLETVWKIEQT